jgi:hypothetical protein
MHLPLRHEITAVRRFNRAAVASTIALLVVGSTLWCQSVAADTLAASEDDAFSVPINGTLGTTDSAPHESDVSSNDESAWSLPMLGPMGLRNLTQSRVVVRTTISAPQQKQPDQLSASISSDGDRVSQQIDRLLDAALERDDNTKVLDTAVAHYNKTSQKIIAQGKDAYDYLVPFRGFGPSSEAGDVILGEKLKLKSAASAEFARQKHIDETHSKVVTSMMQMAMGLGMGDAERGGAVADSGYESLKQLVGEEQASTTKQMLLDQARDAQMPEDLFQHGVWDVAEKQDKHKLIVETSMDEDPVVKEITRRVHKYNHKGKVAMASSHIIQSVLGSAALTPNFVGPAAKFALLSYVMATGGPEQVKIMKELYLDKRFESRYKVTSEEAHLALDNYEVAILTHNKVLFACAQSVLSEMIPDDTLQQVTAAPQICQRPKTGA